MRVRSLAGGNIGNVFHMEHTDALRAIASGTCEEVTGREHVVEPEVDTLDVTPGAVAAPLSDEDTAEGEPDRRRKRKRQRVKR